jgi:hypothetical protein
LQALEKAAEALDAQGIKETLKKIIPEYQPDSKALPIVGLTIGSNPVVDHQTSI